MVERNGELVRLVSTSWVDTLRRVERSGLYEALQASGLLIRHDELPASASGELILRPERVPFISYPYEWTPLQLRHAALATLDIALEAFRRGQILRDASAFNMQFVRGRAVHIDTLSFEPWREGTPWLAYGQFCRHFLAPLALATLVSPDLVRLAGVYPDGIPLPAATDLLGTRGLLRPGLLVHLHLHGAADHRSTPRFPSKHTTIGRKQIVQTLDGLRSTIEALPNRLSQSAWLSYDGGQHYDGRSRQVKGDFVAHAISRLQPSTIWDLGANRGELSIPHASERTNVVAVEYDLACASACHAQAYRDRRPVVALWSDVLAPTPAVGWANEERASLSDRGPADLVLALALVHHLAISGRVPFERITDWFARLGRHVIAEIPEPNDPMVRHLMVDNASPAHQMGKDAFRAASAPYFEILAERELPGLPRTLFLMRRRRP